MSMSEARKYDPRSFKALTFHDGQPGFGRAPTAPAPISSAVSRRSRSVNLSSWPSPP